MHCLCRYIKIYQSLCLSWTELRGPCPHQHEDTKAPGFVPCGGWMGWQPGEPRGNPLLTGSTQVWGHSCRHRGLLGHLSQAAAGWEPQPQRVLAGLPLPASHVGGEPYSTVTPVTGSPGPPRYLFQPTARPEPWAGGSRHFWRASTPPLGAWHSAPRKCWSWRPCVDGG